MRHGPWMTHAVLKPLAPSPVVNGNLSPRIPDELRVPSGLSQSQVILDHQGRSGHHPLKDIRGRAKGRHPLPELLMAGQHTLEDNTVSFRHK
jgi:hypothetical protein